MKPKPVKKKEVKALDVMKLTVADIQKIMDDNSDNYTCLSATFDKPNLLDNKCGRYYIRYRDDSLPADYDGGTEFEDIVHIFDRDNGEFWIRY